MNNREMNDKRERLGKRLRALLKESDGTPSETNKTETSEGANTEADTGFFITKDIYPDN